MTCKMCVKAGPHKPPRVSPRRCAFNDEGVYVRGGHGCETAMTLLDLVRDAKETTTIFREDEWVHLYPVCELELESFFDDYFEAHMLIVQQYKSRNSVNGIWMLASNDKCPRPITEALAVHLINYLARL